MTTSEIMYLKIEDQKEAYLEYCLCTKRLSINATKKLCCKFCTKKEKLPRDFENY